MKREYPHTPLPWRRSGGCIMDKRGNLIAIRRSWTTIDADGYPTEDRGEGTISPCEADSNAALIDIACNYHDDLVTAADAVTGSVIIGEILDEPERIEVDYSTWLTLVQLLEEIEEVRKAGDR